MSASASPTSLAGVGSAVSATAGKAQGDSGLSLNSFLASLAVAAAVFGVESILFILIKNKFSRIYQPRTYLVPKRERTAAPPSGILSWIIPVFRTSNSDFIQKSGLDAYFFLRYLRTLLKIFIPIALVILPILLPMNLIGGLGPDGGVKGMDQLSWTNVNTKKHVNRYWAHLVLAVVIVCYVCYIFYDELRGYIRLRQAYLTSPQHRLRASATTVLVTAIPRKWLTINALDQLYDVFPGGLRNIWINRNFDELSEKVKERNKLALKLEAAETDLIKNAVKAHRKKEKKGRKHMSKAEALEEEREEDARADQFASGSGVSSGDPHQIRHSVREALSDPDPASLPREDERKRPRIPVPIVGQGLEVVGGGIDRLGHTVAGGFRKVGRDVNERLTSNSFAPRDDIPQSGNRTDPAVDGGTQTRAMPHQHNEGSHAEHARDVPRTAGTEANGAVDAKGGSGWMFWKKGKKTGKKNGEDDELPLSYPSPVTPGANPQATINGRRASSESGNVLRKKRDISPKKRGAGKEGSRKGGEEFPAAYNEEYAEDDYGEPVWKRYLSESDRETMRLPIFGWSWMPSLPLLGKKVDTIHYCRKEVARLNLEIEQGQQEPERYPLMNSAFVQFNHQVAAHMACQSVSHHIPQHMTPRHVEVSPDDVIWENMSIRWWERYIRTALVIIVVVGLVIGWAFPVTFTGLVSQVSYLTALVPWLDWVNKLPGWLLGIIQGVLPQLLLAILMALLPVILRLLAKQQGVHTGMAMELSVQNYYFAFLFVQVFLVVSLSSGITTVLQKISKDVTSAPGVLAQNLPKAGNYFFSYMLLQAFSVSAGALVQIGGLISWFILSPLLDSTARQKWTRQTSLPRVQWGTFFPVFTNLACIGIIYSVISPLILVFNIITFSLFWVVYRYNTLYVTKFRFDTGGLLYPKALNQLFTGLYVMELCLIGLFFLIRDDENKVVCLGQGIVMSVITGLTVIYQYLLNSAFGPLLRYLPITLEDDAVARDEEFARAQQKKWNIGGEEEDERRNLNDVLEERERREREADKIAEEIEMDNIELKKRHKLDPRKLMPEPSRWTSSSRNRRSKDFGHYPHRQEDAHTTSHHHIQRNTTKDLEAQRVNPIGDALFGGVHDEIEDLTPDERDKLVQRAFQHEALRAKRPVIWIPRDELGISDDEVYRTQRFSKHIWISNEHTGLDSKGRVVYRRSPPDFSELDLIEL
ncbi:hypothetical protein FGG08_002704 [Glutinoglossum americanum]|uniref:DUF221-domain-containing protein n=1 Tax=Glutinoglossum americanum TaxID=1670608 RepID=A0A9P8KYX1_9PEZI|nr:hypothetical protein FGG08_002704 [Glutinoglossum americanum]